MLNVDTFLKTAVYKISVSRHFVKPGWRRGVSLASHTQRPRFCCVKSFLCCSDVWKGHDDDLFDLYLSRDSEVCRVSS